LLRWLHESGAVRGARRRLRSGPLRKAGIKSTKMPDTLTIDVPVNTPVGQVRPDDLYQVVLHNDDHNTMEYVVLCLMRVFGHPRELAVKIMLEAHSLGRAVAEVEPETPARQHRDQLQSCGLTATIEKIQV